MSVEKVFSEVAEIASRGISTELFMLGTSEVTASSLQSGMEYINIMTHTILEKMNIITPLDITTSIQQGDFMRYVLGEITEVGGVVTRDLEAGLYGTTTDAITHYFSTGITGDINIKDLTRNVARYLIDKSRGELKSVHTYGSNILYSMNYVRQSERVAQDVWRYLVNNGYLTADEIKGIIELHGEKWQDVVADYGDWLRPQYTDALERKFTDIIVDATSEVNEKMKNMEENIEIYDEIIKRALERGTPIDVGTRTYIDFVDNFNLYKNSELAYRVTYNEYLHQVYAEGGLRELTFFDKAKLELKTWSDFALEIGVNAAGQIKYGYNNMVYWFAQYLYSLGNSTTWHAAVSTVMNEAGLGATLTGAALLGTQGGIWATFMSNVMLMLSPIGGMIIKAASVSIAAGSAILGVLKAGMTFISGALMFHGLFGVFCVGLATGAIAGAVYIGTKMRNYIGAGNLNEAMQELHARFPIIPETLIDKYYYINVLVLTFAPEIKPYEHEERTLGNIPRKQYPENKILSDEENAEEAKRQLREKYSGWERVRGRKGDILLADLRKQSQTEFFFPYVNDDAATDNSFLKPLVEAILTHQDCFTPKPVMFMFARIEVVAIEKVK